MPEKLRRAFAPSTLERRPPDVMRAGIGWYYPACDGAVRAAAITVRGRVGAVSGLPWLVAAAVADRCRELGVVADD